MIIDEKIMKSEQFSDYIGSYPSFLCKSRMLRAVLLINNYRDNH
jgi:hypothetical protein